MSDRDVVRRRSGRRRCARGQLALPRRRAGTAQYFGRNKVQYQNFDFRSSQTAHFDIYYYPEERPPPTLAARMAERWYARLSARARITSSPAASPSSSTPPRPHFEQTNVVAGGIGEGTGGVTEALRRRIVLPTGGTLGRSDHVLGHELVHAFQYDMTGGGRRARREPAPRPRCRCGSSRAWPSTSRSARSTRTRRCGCAARPRTPRATSCRPSSQLDDPRYFPYRYGQALLAYVGGTYGDDRIGELLRAARPRRAAWTRRSGAS